MILEGLLTTTRTDGAPHLAPMGPIVRGNFEGFLFRPFPGSTTCDNLLLSRQGVFHVTDDACLIARSAIHAVEEMPALRRAEHVEGYILQDTCRYYEFRIRDVDTRQERVHLEAEVVGQGVLRDFWGFNRARHALIEGAILATRFHLLPVEEVAAEYMKLRTLIEKTGGDCERQTWQVLENARLAFLAGTRSGA